MSRKQWARKLSIPAARAQSRIGWESGIEGAHDLMEEILAGRIGPADVGVPHMPTIKSEAESLRALGPVALRRLQAVLQDDAPDQRDRISHDLMKVLPSVGAQLLGQLVAFCDMNRAARLEVLRGIREALDDGHATYEDGGML